MSIAFLRRFIISSIALCSALAAQADPAIEDHAIVDPNLTLEDDAFFSRQARDLLDEVNRALAQYPPQVPEPLPRILAKRIMDGVLHEVYAPNRLPVQRFYHERIEKAVQDMETRKVAQGAVIWKLYNHGFIVKTPTVTLGFDLHRGTEAFRVVEPEKRRKRVPAPNFPIPDSLAERVARQCDVLFVSHSHYDHADPFIAQTLLNLNRPVVSTEETFKNTPFRDQLTFLKRESNTVQKLPIQDGSIILDVVIYPGQQYQNGGALNNVAVVTTPEGLTFAHNGDQINDPYPEYQKDYQWIDQVHKRFDIDVLMTNCWLNDMLRFVRGFDPKLVLPGHEVEMGHQTWDRMPYWGDAEFLNLTYPQVLTSGYPLLVMTWGEAYHYVPQTP